MDGLRNFIAKRENWQAASEAAKVASRELRAEREAQRDSPALSDEDDTDEES